jgi:branched-chain amino acid transport system substrate-binding protein
MKLKMMKLGFVSLSTALMLSACATGAPTSSSKPAAKPADTSSSNEKPNDSQKTAASSGKPIKLGNLGPFTGRAALYGQIQKIAVEMAVEEVNKNGGINGSPIQMQFEDDQHNPQQAVTQYRKLVGEDVIAVIGPMSGANWENVGPIANQSKVPTINVNAVKPGITKLPWAIRIHPADNTLIPEGVKDFKKHYPNIKKVVVVGDIKEASGAAGIEEFKKSAAAEGFEVLDTVGYQTGATDFSPAITKVKGYKPDAIFVSSLAAESLGAAKEIERQGLDVPILSSALTWVGPFPTAVGTAGKNWYGIGFATNQPDAANEKLVNFTKEFLKRSETNSTIQQPANIANSTLAYDSVLLIAELLRKEKINGDTPVQDARKKLQENLIKMKDYKGLTAFSMLESGDAGYIAARVLKLDVDKKIWVEMK